MTARRIAIRLLLWIMPALPVSAQRVVPDRVACPSCMIELTRPLVLQTDKAPVGINGPTFPAGRDAAGRIWVLAEGDVPAVFGRNGEFLRMVGRLGAGPGEFRWPYQATMLPGDSILIVDTDLRARLRMTRIEVIDWRQLRLVTSRLVDGLPISLDSDLNLITYDEKNDVPRLTLFGLRLRTAQQ